MKYNIVSRSIAKNGKPLYLHYGQRLWTTDCSEAGSWDLIPVSILATQVNGLPEECQESE